MLADAGVALARVDADADAGADVVEPHTAWRASHRLRPEGCETGAKPGVSGCISNLSDSDGVEFNPTRPRGGVGAAGIGVKTAEFN